MWNPALKMLAVPLYAVGCLTITEFNRCNRELRILGHVCAARRTQHETIASTKISWDAQNNPVETDTSQPRGVNYP